MKILNANKKRFIKQQYKTIQRLALKDDIKSLGKVLSCLTGGAGN